jgi:hypothetical protein
MTDEPFPQPTISIALPEPLRLELGQLARQAKTTEGELIQQAVEYLVQAQRGPAIPRFARRLGPIAIGDTRAR